MIDRGEIEETGITEPCDCIAELDRELAAAGHNAALLTDIFGPPRAVIQLYKPDTSRPGRPPVVEASFCPFCGARYARKARAIPQALAVA